MSWYDSGMIPRLTKRPLESRLMEVELGPIMRMQDTIREVIEVAGGGLVSISDVSHNDTIVTFLVSGGDAGALIPMRIRIRTESDPIQELVARVDLHVLSDP